MAQMFFRKYSLIYLVFNVLAVSAQTVTYQPSNEDFANPERGFMRFTETSSGNYSPLVASEMASWRNLHQPGDASYAIYSTLVYRGFYLETFKNGPISSAYLNAVSADFSAARQAGVKLVIRFAYTHKDTPPFGDAPKSIVLQHIAQLKPLLMANADVIAVLQMGFIGAWGEGYYTDYFGYGSLNAQNWADRTEVLNALLNAIPSDRQVQVRVPQMKQKAIYGVNAPPNSPALNISEAWQSTAKARIGFFNDCFLASSDDFGTYSNYDINPSGCDTCAFKPYFSQDSRYVAVGGETCSDWDPYSDCIAQAGGGAQNEMARMHWSYLNSDWNNEVNNDWVDGACIDEITRRLGYRLELQKGQFTTEARPGQVAYASIALKNKGFAAPFNNYKVRLLLRNTLTHEVWFTETFDNPRSWLPGSQTYMITHSYCLPQDMPKGTYEWLLQLTDPYASLDGKPAYSIRLANEGLWEANTGYNKLMQTLELNDVAESFACNGQNCYQPLIPVPASAEFRADDTVACAPTAVVFFNQSSSCWNYQWIFLGGTPQTSTESNPLVYYYTPGDYDVALTVTTPGGISSVLKKEYIHISGIPQPDFGWNENGLSVQFVNSTLYALPNAYEWNFGDGTSYSGGGNPVHQYSGVGNYTITLTAYSACGIATVTKTLNLNCPNSFIQIYSPPEAICGDTSVTIYAPPGFAQYYWYYYGSYPFAQTMADSVQIHQSGIYSVTAVAANGCESYSNLLLFRFGDHPLPSFNYTSNGLNVQFSNTSLYSNGFTWDFGDGSAESQLKSPAHTYPAPGAYPVTLKVENNLCGTLSITQTINLSCPALSLSLNADAIAFCDGDSTVLRVSGDDFTHYQWYQSGAVLPFAENDTLTVGAPGVYEVQAELWGCEQISNPLSIEVWPNPLPVITPPGPIYLSPGDTVLLDAGGAYANWNWNTGAAIAQIPVAGCETYWVMVADSNDCIGVSAPVEVFTPAAITFENGVLTSTPSESYQWYWNGQLISGATELSFLPTLSGIYYVETACNGMSGLKSNELNVLLSNTHVPSTGFIRFYPNPVSADEDELSIYFEKQAQEAFTLIIADLAGKEIIRQLAPGGTDEWRADIRILPRGSFVVKMDVKGKSSVLGMLFRQ